MSAFDQKRTLIGLAPGSYRSFSRRLHGGLPLNLRGRAGTVRLFSSQVRADRQGIGRGGRRCAWPVALL